VRRADQCPWCHARLPRYRGRRAVTVVVTEGGREERVYSVGRIVIHRCTLDPG